ncbi:hypothetical protein TNCV_4497981 [Trichonephila clavipes]|nr:hypothetical protein TNCV_4497981 [Trichonephila clavipes]
MCLACPSGKACLQLGQASGGKSNVRYFGESGQRPRLSQGARDRTHSNQGSWVGAVHLSTDVLIMRGSRGLPIEKTWLLGRLFTGNPNMTLQVIVYPYEIKF